VNGVYCANCGHSSAYHGVTFCSLSVGTPPGRPCDCTEWLEAEARGPDCSRERIRSRNVRQCAECHRVICDRHSYIRVDESNESITRHSPKFCRECADRLEPRVA
jgi:adenosylmethionine-8-amino-7-oxononanoate aminotransferase